MASHKAFFVFVDFCGRLQRAISGPASSGSSSSLASDIRGVSTIELAVVTPVVGVLLVGLLDLGMLVHQEMDLTNAARVGAQYAFQDSTDTATMASTAINAVGPLLPSLTTPTATAALSCECPASASNYAQTSTVACSVTSCTGTGAKPTMYATVTINQAYSPVLGGWGLVKARTVTATASIRVN